MNRKYLFATTIVLMGVLANAGCKREAATTSEGAPSAETQPVADIAPASAPDAATDQAMAADNALDTKAFAGNFSGTLPCADCPGIDTEIELHTDGRFMLMEAYQGKKAEPAMLEGTWTAEENGSRIRLDPDSKSEQDRVYALASHDQIAQLGSDGAPAASGLDYSLKRTAAKP